MNISNNTCNKNRRFLMALSVMSSRRGRPASIWSFYSPITCVAIRKCSNNMAFLTRLASPTCWFITQNLHVVVQITCFCLIRKLVMCGTPCILSLPLLFHRCITPKSIKSAMTLYQQMDDHKMFWSRFSHMILC